MAAAVVANGRANGLGDLADLREQFLDRKLLQIGMAFESLIEIVDVTPMVLVVMNLHRSRVDVRFQRIEGVREGRQIVAHYRYLLSLRFVFVIAS